MKIPKKWRGANWQLHHFVNLITDSLSGEEVIISKTWNRRHQAWKYHAEKRHIFESTQKAIKQVAKNEKAPS